MDPGQGYLVGYLSWQVIFNGGCCCLLIDHFLVIHLYLNFDCFITNIILTSPSYKKHLFHFPPPTTIHLDALSHYIKDLDQLP